MENRVPENLEKLRKINAEIGPEDIQKLPLAKPSGKIHLIEDPEDFEKSWKVFNSDIKKTTVIGFDTESRPSFKKGQDFPICLLQLSSPEHTLLIRLNKMNIPDVIKNILEDSSLIKVGLAIHDDIRGLKKVAKINPEGFVDLADKAKKLQFKKLGLKNLTATMLKKKLSKKAKLSNWEANKLNPTQVDYAALDAQISRDLYFSLQEFSD